MSTPSAGRSSGLAQQATRYPFRVTHNRGPSPIGAARPGRCSTRHMLPSGHGERPRFGAARTQRSGRAPASRSGSVAGMVTSGDDGGHFIVAGLRLSAVKTASELHVCGLRMTLPEFGHMRLCPARGGRVRLSVANMWRRSRGPGCSQSTCSGFGGWPALEAGPWCWPSGARDRAGAPRPWHRRKNSSIPDVAGPSLCR